MINSSGSKEVYLFPCKLVAVSNACDILLSSGLLKYMNELSFLSAYSTVSGVNGPLVILDNVKVKLQSFVIT